MNLLDALNWKVAPPSIPPDDTGDEGKPNRGQAARVIRQIENQLWMIEVKEWKSSYTIDDLMVCGESRAVVERVIDDMRQSGYDKALKYLIG